MSGVPSFLLALFWFAAWAAAPAVALAAPQADPEPADQSAIDSARTVVADPEPREVSRHQDSAFLTRTVSAVMPADGLLAVGLGGRYGSIMYADGDQLYEVDFFDALVRAEWNARPWLHLAAELPVRNLSGGPTGAESAFGLRDVIWRLDVGLPGGDWWHWSVFAGSSLPTGSGGDGLSEGVVSPESGLAASLRFWEHAAVPELRIHLNLGYRWNRNEQDGYGVGLGTGLQPWFPRYQDAARAGDNDYLMLGAALEFRRGTTSLWVEYTNHAMRWDRSVSGRENPHLLCAGLRWGVVGGWALHAAYEVGLQRDDPATAYWPAYPDLVYNLGVSKQFPVGGRDRDGDGIPDRADACPDHPEDRDGFADDDGCPEYDNDHDTVPDAVDLAPNEPEDRDGWRDADGAPDLDNDGDGILDSDDPCPDAPEDFDGDADDDGCPDAPRSG